VKRALVIGVLAAGVFANSAAGALWLVFSKTTAAPRETVSVRTAGAGALRSIRRGSPPLRVFLVPAAIADQIHSVRDSRLIPLGSLKRDRLKNGRLAFRVPNVPPGDYSTLLYCVPCAPRSAGRSLLPVGPFPGPFHVVEAAPAVRDCASAVYGELAPDWPSHAFSLGPLSLLPFEPIASEPAARFGKLRGTRRAYEPVKVLALVRGDTPVTLAVPLDERSVVGIVYAVDAIGRVSDAKTVTAADAAVTFQPCTDPADPYTQFNGGFAVAGARCVRLDVRVQRQPDVMRLELPFGAAC
jgi:hypothetical protein